jgi:hypothetical protein
MVGTPKWEQFSDFIAQVEKIMDDEGQIGATAVNDAGRECGLFQTQGSTIFAVLKKMGIVQRCTEGVRVYYKKK